MPSMVAMVMGSRTGGMRREGCSVQPVTNCSSLRSREFCVVCVCVCVCVRERERESQTVIPIERKKSYQHRHIRPFSQLCVTACSL